MINERASERVTEIDMKRVRDREKKAKQTEELTSAQNSPPSFLI